MPPSLNLADSRFKRHANRRTHLAQRRLQRPSLRGWQTKTSTATPVSAYTTDTLCNLTRVTDPLNNSAAFNYDLSDVIG